MKPNFSDRINLLKESARDSLTMNDEDAQEEIANCILEIADMFDFLLKGLRRIGEKELE